MLCSDILFFFFNLIWEHFNLSWEHLSFCFFSVSLLCRNKAGSAAGRANRESISCKDAGSSGIEGSRLLEREFKNDRTAESQKPLGHPQHECGSHHPCDGTPVYSDAMSLSPLPIGSFPAPSIFFSSFYRPIQFHLPNIT